MSNLNTNSNQNFIITDTHILEHWQCVQPINYIEYIVIQATFVYVHVYCIRYVHGDTN